jgi:cytochrome c oxidase subunit 2
VDAQTPAQFQAWVQSMQHPQSTPTTALAKEGETYFQTVGCSGCHAIAGTTAVGIIGPNLTGLANRPMIAGNVLPNTPQNLARWISDPQAVKPGALMPKLPLTPHEVQALVAYLESLK